jgi:hypothetical protein
MKPPTALTALLASLLTLTACKTLESVGLKKVPPVIVELPFEGETIEIPVEASGPSEYETALNAVRYKQYQDAAAQLETLANRKPKDAKLCFALAVAQEAAGDYAKAKANYIRSDALDGTQANLNCEAGAARCEQRLK